MLVAKPLIAAKVKNRMLAGEKDPLQISSEGAKSEICEKFAKLAGVALTLLKKVWR